jgi:hypothetical protein
MTDEIVPFALPSLPLLRARVTLRLLQDATLPHYKGAMLRGGFGYAFHRAACPQECWALEQGCAANTICPYRWVFETPRPPQVGALHDLRDVPRPFVIELSGDNRARYQAGDTLEFVLVLIGGGIDHLPYFLFGFEQFARLGLGMGRARARLERVEALEPWQPFGTVIYQDGRASDVTRPLPILTGEEIARRAARMPEDLRLTIATPLRVKAGNDYLRAIDPAALVRAVCWRLNALATFHGDGPWPFAYRPLVEQARGIGVEQAQARWEDWERTSTRGEQRRMVLGGIVGGALLRGVPAELRAVLLAGSLIHVGKACVFGHGAYRVEEV